MTRLRDEDIKDIDEKLGRYNDELVQKTGRSLLSIACHAAGTREEETRRFLGAVPAAVVPVTSGQGIIAGFSHTVKAILEFIGMDAFVTEKGDVAGMAEAFAKGALLLFLADDHQFAAFNLNRRSVVDNAEATGKGFAAGLDLMSGGLTGEKVLVLGCGPVGYASVLFLLGLGVTVSVYDIITRRSEELRERVNKEFGFTVRIETGIEPALSKHRFIIDATNAAGIISDEFIRSRTCIAAPGMPLGLTPAARARVSGRLLHDPLQIGVAVMAVEAVRK